MVQLTLYLPAHIQLERKNYLFVHTKYFLDTSWVSSNVTQFRC